jgi:hypothetical protein
LLFALGQPAAFVGLLIAFLLGLVLRAVAIRFAGRALGLADRRDSVAPRLREDIDPFGAVAAAVGGAGWGKAVDVDEVPRTRGRGRAAAVFAAGPVLVLLVAQVAFAVYRFVFPESGMQYLTPSVVLQGQFTAPIGVQVLLAIAVGLLGFGLLALIPLPPLDGFGLLWSALRRPGPRMQNARLWLDHKNIGVVILLACSFFPLGNPILLWPLNLLGTPFLRLWG